MLHGILTPTDTVEAADTFRAKCPTDTNSFVTDSLKGSGKGKSIFLMAL